MNLYIFFYKSLTMDNIYVYLNLFISEQGIIKLIIKMISHKLADIFNKSGVKISYSESKLFNPNINFTFIYHYTTIKYNKNIVTQYESIKNKKINDSLVKIWKYVHDDSGKIVRRYFIAQTFHTLTLDINIYGTKPMTRKTRYWNRNININKAQIKEYIEFEENKFYKDYTDM